MQLAPGIQLVRASRGGGGGESEPLLLQMRVVRRQVALAIETRAGGRTVAEAVALHPLDAALDGALHAHVSICMGTMLRLVDAAADAAPADGIRTAILYGAAAAAEPDFTFGRFVQDLRDAINGADGGGEGRVARPRRMCVVHLDAEALASGGAAATAAKHVLAGTARDPAELLSRRLYAALHAAGAEAVQALQVARQGSAAATSADDDDDAAMAAELRTRLASGDVGSGGGGVVSGSGAAGGPESSMSASGSAAEADAAAGTTSAMTPWFSDTPWFNQPDPGRVRGTTRSGIAFKEESNAARAMHRKHDAALARRYATAYSRAVNLDADDEAVADGDEAMRVPTEWRRRGCVGATGIWESLRLVGGTVSASSAAAAAPPLPLEPSSYRHSNGALAVAVASWYRFLRWRIAQEVATGTGAVLHADSVPCATPPSLDDSLVTVPIIGGVPVGGGLDDGEPTLAPVVVVLCLENVDRVAPSVLQFVVHTLDGANAAIARLDSAATSSTTVVTGSGSGAVSAGAAMRIVLVLGSQATRTALMARLPPLLLSRLELHELRLAPPRTSYDTFVRDVVMRGGLAMALPAASLRAAMSLVTHSTTSILQFIDYYRRLVHAFYHDVSWPMVVEAEAALPALQEAAAAIDGSATEDETMEVAGRGARDGRIEAGHRGGAKDPTLSIATVAIALRRLVVPLELLVASPAADTRPLSAVASTSMVLDEVDTTLAVDGAAPAAVGTAAPVPLLLRQACLQAQVLDGMSLALAMRLPSVMKGMRAMAQLATEWRRRGGAEPVAAPAGTHAAALHKPSAAISLAAEGLVAAEMMRPLSTDGVTELEQLVHIAPQIHLALAAATSPLAADSPPEIELRPLQASLLPAGFNGRSVIDGDTLVEAPCGDAVAPLFPWLVSVAAAGSGPASATALPRGGGGGARGSAATKSLEELLSALRAVAAGIYMCNARRLLAYLSAHVLALVQHPPRVAAATGPAAAALSTSASHLVPATTAAEDSAIAEAIAGATVYPDWLIKAAESPLFETHDSRSSGGSGGGGSGGCAVAAGGTADPATTTTAAASLSAYIIGRVRDATVPQLRLLAVALLRLMTEPTGRLYRWQHVLPSAYAYRHHLSSLGKLLRQLDGEEAAAAAAAAPAAAESASATPHKSSPTPSTLPTMLHGRPIPRTAQKLAVKRRSLVFAGILATYQAAPATKAQDAFLAWLHDFAATWLSPLHEGVPLYEVWQAVPPAPPTTLGIGAPPAHDKPAFLSPAMSMLVIPPAIDLAPQLPLAMRIPTSARDITELLVKQHDPVLAALAYSDLGIALRSLHMLLSETRSFTRRAVHLRDWFLLFRRTAFALPEDLVIRVQDAGGSGGSRRGSRRQHMWRRGDVDEDSDDEAARATVAVALSAVGGGSGGEAVAPTGRSRQGRTAAAVAAAAMHDSGDSDGDGGGDDDESGGDGDFDADERRPAGSRKQHRAMPALEAAMGSVAREDVDVGGGVVGSRGSDAGGDESGRHGYRRSGSGRGRTSTGVAGRKRRRDQAFGGDDIGALPESGGLPDDRVTRELIQQDYDAMRRLVMAVRGLEQAGILRQQAARSPADQGLLYVSSPSLLARELW